MVAKALLSFDTGMSERQLIERAQTGDTEAFGDLVGRHMRRTYYAALGLLGSHDDALDLSQEAFARAFNARKKLDPERPFYPWLYQILRRLCFNALRNQAARVRKLREAAHWLEQDASHRSIASDPAAQVERKEMRDRIERAIGQLPAHEREILVMREFEELRYREIAELLGIPVGTVMSRLYAARRGLADALGSDI